MGLATNWFWLLAIVCATAFAMTTRRVLHFVARRIISVNDDDRPLSPRQRALIRYQQLSFHPHFFAWCKTQYDAMFDELPALLGDVGKVRKFLDLGCGFGVAGSFLLEVLPGSEIYGIDPSRQRIANAKLAFGDRGYVFEGAAPDFENPDLPERFDAVFAIDMVHYLNDRALDLTLWRLRDRLGEGGRLIIRAPMRPDGSGSLIWKLTRIHYTAWGLFAQYRTVEQLRERIEKGGFHVVHSQISGNNPELHWFVSTAAPLKQEIERLVAEPVTAVGNHGEQHHRQNDDDVD